MFRKLMDFLRGKLLIHISGLSPERFLNLCAARGLEINCLKATEEGFECRMSLRDYREARGLARKAKVMLHICEKRGLPFLLFRYRKRKAYAAGILLSLILLYSLSVFLWDIQVVGNSYYTDDIILTFLKENNIRHGMQMSDIVCDELEQALRNQYTNITWVSAQISGTRLIIQVKENFGLLEIPEKIEEPGDLVADRDGVITELVTRVGIPLVKAGDEVTRGQVLVSGRVSILNDGGEIAGYQEVTADATIRARVVEEYSWERSIFYEEKRVIDKSFQGVSLRIGENRVNARKSDEPEAYHYQITEYWQPRLFRNFYLPITLEKTTDYTYEVLQRRMTEEEQTQSAQEELQEYLREWQEKGGQLLEQNLSLTPGALKLTATGNLVLEGPFGELVPLGELSQDDTIPEETEEIMTE